MNKGTFFGTKVVEVPAYTEGKRKDYHVQLLFQEEDGIRARTIYGTGNKAKAMAVSTFLVEALHSQYTMLDLNRAHLSVIDSRSKHHEDE